MTKRLLLYTFIFTSYWIHSLAQENNYSMVSYSQKLQF